MVFGQMNNCISLEGVGNYLFILYLRPTLKCACINHKFKTWNKHEITPHQGFFL